MLGKGKENKPLPFRPSRLSLGGTTNGEHLPPGMPDIIKCGYLRKLKTMKKKFFLLRMDSDSGPARLEYYDSEKKWRMGVVCKRSIILKTCFNINKKMDSKQKFVIALYTKDDCFAIVLDNELELDDWLTTLLALQQGHTGLEGDVKPKPNFEHVWQVNVKNKGLGSSRNITGMHRLCLTSKTLSLVKMNAEDPDLLDFPLMSIRRCGHSDCFFFMELGRSSITGAGELWMQTEDTIIAQNMHEAILGAMKSSRDHEDLGPLNRPRSASTSENSKPLATRPRPVGVVPPQPTRDRCDSMPSRSRTVSEGHHDISGSPQNPGRYSSPSRGVTHHYEIPRAQAGSYSQSLSYSPPFSSNSLAASVYSDSAGSSLSMDDLESSSDFHHRYHSHSSDVNVHTEPTITEEPQDDYLPMTPGADGSQTDYMQMGPASSNQQRSSSMYLNLTTEADNFSNPSSPTSGDYMDMATPSSTPSVPDTAEGYIPMSPVGSLSVDLSSIPSSKKSSIVADLASPSYMQQHPDGYIPMAPISRAPEMESTGYMEMTSLSSSLPKCTSPGGSGYMDLNSPTHSSHSLQDLAYSCSPVVPKMEEFHLDKVKSYFPPSEETDDYIKPVRAYSIGSRPQLRKNHLSSHLESFRVRAYSFGSQASGGNNNCHSGIEAELGSMKKMDSRASGKSSSAPLLPSGPQPSSRGRVISGRGDDLMEIVYASTSSSRSSGERIRTFSHGSSRQHAARHLASEGKASRVKSAKIPTEVIDSRNGSNPYMMMGSDVTEKKSEDPKKSDSKSIRASGAPKSGNNSGDYVNLELTSPTWPSSKKLTEHSTIVTKPGPSANHNYINLQLGSAGKTTPPLSKKSISTDSDYSDYTMMSPGKELFPSSTTKPILEKPSDPEHLKSDRRSSADQAIEAEVSELCRPPTELLDDNEAVASQKTSPFASVKRKSIVEGMYENILIAPGSASSSRPSSVSSERELNYASLDLAPTCAEDTPRSPRSLKAPNPSPPERTEAPLSYAEIDFTKSEGLRHTSGSLREGRV